jgi:hypothetical protein
MVNFVETLFGLTAAGLLIALALLLMRRRARARRVALAALAIGLVAGALELYLQIRT